MGRGKAEEVPGVRGQGIGNGCGRCRGQGCAHCGRGWRRRVEAGARQLDDIPGSVDSNHLLGSRLDLMFLFFLASSFSSGRRKLLGLSRVTTSY